MLLPIGQEDATVRRHPWVTYALLAVNFLAFALTALSGPGAKWEAAVEAKLVETVKYMAERPYLEIPADLEDFCDEEFRQALRERRRLFAQARRVPDAATVAFEQARLETLGVELRGLRDQLPLRRYGYIPAQGRPSRALSSMFVHAGWLHLLGNLLFLFVTGPFVEDAFGRVIFPVLYLLSGLAALATHALRFPTSVVPLVGASGAIAGVMGAFLVRFATRRVRMLFLPLFPFPRPRFTFAVPAFVFLPIWFGEQSWYAARAGEESGVAFWAHVGGFLFGAAFAMGMRMGRVEERLVRPAIEKELGLEQHPGLERALQARLAGDLDSARRLIATVLAAEPLNPDAWRERYLIAGAAGDLEEAGQAATRLAELLARDDQRDLLLELLAEPSLRRGPVPARLFLIAGRYLEQRGDWDMALDVYDRLIRRLPADPGAFRALVRRAEILRQGGDTEAARKALLAARAHPACSAEQAPQVDRALAALERPRPTA